MNILAQTQLENQTAVHSTTATTFDGPISISMTVLFGLVLLCLFSWSLHRERFVLGTRTTLGFAALRLICIATVLWMLLAPTRVLMETATTPRTIAIITDTSASMTTVDPPGTADDVRWLNIGADNAVGEGSSENHATVLATALADNALAAIGIAERELTSSMDAVRRHASDQEIADLIVSAQKAIEHCKANLDQLRQWPLSASVGSERTQAIEPVLQNASRSLDGSEFSEFQNLAKRLATGRTPKQTDWRESLQDLQYRVRGSQQVLQELSRLVADAESQRMQSLPNSNRLDRVATFLESLKKQTLNSLGDSVTVRWSHFDKSSATLDNVDSLKASLLTRVSARGEADGNHADSPSSKTLATNLSAALEPLRSSGNDIPIAAAFVFSDVAHNDTGQSLNIEESSVNETQLVRPPAEVAATLGNTPVYMVPIGNSKRLRDVNLVGVDAPTVAMRNDDIVIEAHLEAHQCQGDRCTVQLLEGAEMVDFREVAIDSDFVTRTVRFQRRVSEVGEASLSVLVSGVEGEMTQANNHRKFGINVTRDQVKILLADEMPRWEFHYLAQLFRRDPKIACDEMLFRPRIIATGNRESSRALPTTVDQWDEYDVVILGDLPPERLPAAAQESLAEYVRRRGGTAVLIAGPRAMPEAYSQSALADLLPVTRAERSLAAGGAGTQDAIEQESFAFQATHEGRSHVALMIGETPQATQTAWDFVNRFSPLHEVSPWCRPKPSAKNLIAVVPRGAQAEENSGLQDSFLCWQPIGRGRIVYFSGPDTYRLRFLRGDRYHHRFWGQLLRWSIAAELDSGSQLVRIRTDKTDYETGQDVNVELRLSSKDDTPITDTDDLMLRVSTGDSEQRIALTADGEVPGLYRGLVSSPRPGVYFVEPVGSFVDNLPQSEDRQALRLSFTVQADLPMELSDTRCDRVLAAQVSDLTGGQVLPPSAVAEVLALTDLSPIVTETVQRTPLWSQWKYLWLVFGCLQIEWIIRKWRGLS